MIQHAAFVAMALAILAALSLVARRLDRLLGIVVLASGLVYIAGALVIGDVLLALRGREYLAPDERTWVLFSLAVRRAWAAGLPRPFTEFDGIPVIFAWAGAAWGGASVAFAPARVVSALCGAASFILIYQITVRCFDRRAARVAVALALLTPSLSIWSMLALKERVLGGLAMLAALACIELIRRASVPTLTWLAGSVYAIGFVRSFYAASVGWPAIVAIALARLCQRRSLAPVLLATLAVGAAQTAVTGSPFAYATLFDNRTDALRASIGVEASGQQTGAAAAAFAADGLSSPFMTGNDQVGEAPSPSFMGRLGTVLFGRFRAAGNSARIMSVLLFPDWLLAFAVWPLVVLGIWASWHRRSWLWLAPAGIVASLVLAIAVLPADSWAALRFRIVPWPLALTLAAGGAVWVFDRRSSLPAPVSVAARWVRTTLAVWGLLDRTEAASRRTALRLMRAQQPTAGVRGPRVLVFSLRGWAPHAAWENVIAHALRLRGADVHMFTCGGPMPACEVNYRGVSPALACAECRLYPNAIVGALGFEHSRLSSYVSADERRAIERQVASLRADELERWTFDGRPLGQLVQASVLWFLRKRETDVSGSDGEAYRRYLVAGAEIATAAPRLLTAVRPDVVVEVNGQFFAERILHTYVEPPTRVVAYEAGWRLGTVGFDEVTDKGPVDLDDAWKTYGAQPLSDEENRTLDEWMRRRLAGDMQRDFYINFQGGGAGHVLSALGLDPGKPTAVLFTNLVWDTAVIGRDLGFRTISDWLRATVAAFAARPGWQLVIRIHPAEDLRPGQETVEKLGDLVRSLRLTDNIRLVESGQAISSYALIDACRATLVYTSTIGFEAAMRGSRVVLGARVYYRGRGFTIDVADPAEYERALASAMDGAALEQASVERARRFAYLLLFRYLHRVPVVDHRPGRFPLWVPEQTAELVPGVSPQFDRFMDAILTGAPFVAPA